MRLYNETRNGGGIFQNYKANPLLDNYKSVARDMLKLQFPLLGMDEIDMALDWSISNRITDHPIKIDNNYKHQTVDTTLLETARYILDRQPIITSYGVMFKRHGEVPNPVYKLIDGFINDRKKLKKTMFTFPKGSPDYEKYSLLQLLKKIKLKAQSLYIGIYRCKAF
jgi:hypothetical protein